jgi:uncharacterized protein
VQEKINRLEKIATAKKKENLALFDRFNKKKRRDLDTLFHIAHEQVFGDTDCLTCANCCKTLGPRLTNKDVEKIAELMNKKASAIFDDYLKTDEDGDIVFKSMPCPFLLPDNYCSIYENRPKACREYPHTNRANMYQLKNLTIANSLTCPAVFDILEQVKKNSRL